MQLKSQKQLLTLAPAAEFGGYTVLTKEKKILMDILIQNYCMLISADSF